MKKFKVLNGPILEPTWGLKPHVGATTQGGTSYFVFSVSGTPVILDQQQQQQQQQLSIFMATLRVAGNYT